MSETLVAKNVLSPSRLIAAVGGLGVVCMAAVNTASSQAVEYVPEYRFTTVNTADVADADSHDATVALCGGPVADEQLVEIATENGTYRAYFDENKQTVRVGTLDNMTPLGAVEASDPNLSTAVAVAERLSSLRYLDSEGQAAIISRQESRIHDLTGECIALARPSEGLSA